MTGNVTGLAEYKQANTPHIAGEAVCLGCGHEWAAVAPAGVDVLECPKCELEKGVFAGLPQFDEQHWTCGDCGGQLFRITPERTYCAKCGLPQHGFEQ